MRRVTFFIFWLALGFGAADAQEQSKGWLGVTVENLTQDEAGKTLIFDAWNRLVQVKNGSTTLATYGYDALGRRVTENAAGTARDIYFSMTWQAIEDRVSGEGGRALVLDGEHDVICWELQQARPPSLSGLF